MNVYREEYPRPQFVRNEWQNLNGEWEFSFDYKNLGIYQKWYENKEFESKINVPFAYQSKLSGIFSNEACDIVWYKRNFKVNENWKNKKIILHFGAVDYICKVYINSQFVGEHEGGNTNFEFDITPYLNWEQETIVVYAYDPWNEQTLPRGKQFWKQQSEGIWYTRTTGIWQTVWLEPVSPKANIDYVHFTPNIDDGNVTLDLNLTGDFKDLNLSVQISFNENIIIHDKYKLNSHNLIKTIDIYQGDIFRSFNHNVGWCWEPENPNLFDVKLELVDENETILDNVNSYFGMRKIHTEDGIVYLNNRPYYQKLILDQGYWRDGLLTAPHDEDFIKDINLAKSMGFNGCRKHQKVEDPRFLYWADKLGFLVWGEFANSAYYNNQYAKRISTEWFDVIKRDYNHPSIVTWVPLNESWGVYGIDKNKQHQHHSQALYHQIHSIDKTRLVISNDGWELTITDICAIHNYDHGLATEKQKYEYFKKSLSTKDEILKSKPAGRNIYANGFKNCGEPIMLTEFGGIAYTKNSETGWGYTTASTEEEFISDYKRIIDAVYSSDIIYGFCYTQLTDVEQEMNGLLTYDREAKCDLQKIKAINDTWRKNIV